MTRLCRTALVAVLLLGGLAVAPAGASAQWCEEDPLVAIQTPGGNLVVVYVLIGVLGAEHLPAAQAAAITVTVAAVDATAGGRATKVELAVLVPDDAFASAFPTRSTASSEPLGTGVVYDQTEGSSGQPMTLKFTLDVP